MALYKCVYYYYYYDLGTLVGNTSGDFLQGVTKSEDCVQSLYQLSCYVYINRFIIRVVSASLQHNETMVEWETANGATTGSQKVARGQFVEITNPRATEPMKVDCSSPCLVMLYNTGTSYFSECVI